MIEAALLLLGEEERRDLWCSYCSAYILSRGNVAAQDSNLKALDQLASVWGLSESVQDAWHRTTAKRIEQIKNVIEETQNRKRYL